MSLRSASDSCCFEGNIAILEAGLCQYTLKFECSFQQELELPDVHEIRFEVEVAPSVHQLNQGDLLRKRTAWIELFDVECRRFDDLVLFFKHPL